MGVVCELPIRTKGQTARFICAAPSRLQLPDSSENTASGNPAGPQKQKLVCPLCIQLRFDFRAAEYGLYFGGKHQSVRTMDVEQGLDAHSVSGQGQALSAAFPDGKGKNTIEHPNTVHSPLCKGMQHYLCIRMPQEYVAQLHQLPPELTGVVQLPVVYQCIPLCPIRQLHRLTPSCRVHNGKPGVQQCALVLPENALPIRASP